MITLTFSSERTHTLKLVAEQVCELLERRSLPIDLEISLIQLRSELEHGTGVDIEQAFNRCYQQIEHLYDNSANCGGLYKARSLMEPLNEYYGKATRGQR